MNRIGKVLSDEEAFGERDLAAQTVVEAAQCLRLDGGGWKIIQMVKGIVAPHPEKSAYASEPTESDTYAGAQARIMPDSPYPETALHASMHPITINLDPYDIPVEDNGVSVVVTGRWVLRHISASPPSS
jgi:hypothetical protein